MTTICMFVPSPLGDILLRAEDDALTGLFFVGQKYFPSMDSASVTLRCASPQDVPRTLPRVLHDAQVQLAEYFAGERQDFALPLRPRGTAFQRSVWDQLVRIPYGEIESYGRIARRLGLAAGSARAVGAANGRNPVSIVVPCHRVVSSAGDLTGYAGGLHRKQALLSLERPAVVQQQQIALL
ncbi:methylated-DNA--[protein]-cysteine S-methyltransferase [Paraburkholderia sp.]|uniref:methylated-DNA--[protein]-cysteine S-methyltransferase n=1 Tax=Paraburkholderia sp. TaxID=1926495 RepID=UPI003D6E949D